LIIEEASKLHPAHFTRTKILPLIAERALASEPGYEKVPTSKTWLSIAFKELSANKAFEVINTGKGGITIYRLKADLMPFFMAAAKAKDNKKTLKRSSALSAEELSKIEGAYLEIPEKFKSDRLFHFHLPVALRTGKGDKRRTIEEEITMNLMNPITGTPEKQIVKITTTCRSDEDSKIAELSDLPVTIVIDSMFVEHIKTHYKQDIENKISAKELCDKVGNWFIFDIFDVCKVLKIDTKHRDYVAARLRRMQETEFTIDMTDAPIYQKTFGFYGNIATYRYIDSFEILTEDVIVSIDNDEDAERVIASLGGSDNLFGDKINNASDLVRGELVQKKPRMYRVHFNERKFWNLVNDAINLTFDVPISLVEERDGLAWRIGMWCRAAIGVRAKPNVPKYVRQLQEVHQAVAPNYSDIRNFETDFFNVIKAEKNLINVEKYYANETKEHTKIWNENGKNLSLLHGYFIEVNFDEKAINQFVEDSVVIRNMRRPRKPYPIITIWRDKNDKSVGDDSPHNKAVKRKLTASLNSDYE
jgi:hypothetical protein